MKARPVRRARRTTDPGHRYHERPGHPYAWAQSAASQLEQAALLTREGTGHVAYFSSSCVRGVVDPYLVDLTPPAPGTICS